MCSSIYKHHIVSIYCIIISFDDLTGTSECHRPAPLHVTTLSIESDCLKRGCNMGDYSRI